MGVEYVCKDHGLMNQIEPCCIKAVAVMDLRVMIGTVTAAQTAGYTNAQAIMLGHIDWCFEILIEALEGIGEEDAIEIGRATAFAMAKKTGKRIR